MLHLLGQATNIADPVLSPLLQVAGLRARSTARCVPWSRTWTLRRRIGKSCGSPGGSAMAHSDEAHSRAIAEESREKDWKGRSFLRELFLGRLRPELLLAQDDDLLAPETPRFAEFMQQLESFLRREVNPAAIDQSGEYPDHVLRGLAELGAFGLKIKPEYGGLGFSHREY